MRSRLFVPASILVSMIGIAGCSQPTAPGGVSSPVASLEASLGQTVNKELAEVRAATAPYHNIDKAIADGYVQITPCLELPGVGGMGFHYGKVPFDGTATHTSPEVLVYAPNNGQLKLVAVEYIVPQPLAATPPTLFGQTFHANPDINAWVLHAWIWEQNPLGMFEDWNPKVSCGR
jgi:hypothetical protein